MSKQVTKVTEASQGVTEASQAVTVHAEDPVPRESQEMMMFTALNNAIDKGVDAETLQRMLDMQFQVMDRQNERAFNDAMRLAQMEMPPVVANAANTQTRSKYPKLERILDACAPHFYAHGFACSFGEGEGAPPEHIRVICDVSHTAGHTRRYHLDVPIDTKGPKGNDVKTATHGVISAVTYGQSRLMRMIWNVRVIDDPEDDDGNAAGGVELITEHELANLRALLQETTGTEDEFMRHFKIKSMDRIPRTMLPVCISALEQRRDREAKQ